jgi:LAGLIDADG-like domain
MNRYRTVKQLDAPDAAYIAGLVDGEGTVTLSTMHRGENRRLVVSISNTERNLLEFVQEALGTGQITGKRTYSARHTPSFAFRVTNRQAVDLLRQIGPYLRSYKAARAALALTHYIALTPRNGKYRDEVRTAREQFEAAFLSLGPSSRDPAGMRSGSA